MGSDARGLVQFGVLGPLEASRDEEPVRLGGERQRALLALLLVHANELVTIDQLIDNLFGEQRSEAAVNAIRVAVSRLRHTLGDDDGGDVLLTRPGGYLLRVAPEQLDAARFEHAFRHGQQLLESGDPRAAGERLRGALALWRGPPLADLSMLACVQSEIRRLEEQRLMAVMARIDADLAVGAHAELLGELESLVESEPLQERLRGQLMLALYRAGRQPDALAVYRDTSDLLREELGLEPGHALRELERSILNQDVTLDPAPSPGPLPPTGLPVPGTPFLGRVRELGEISALLKRSDTRLLTLTGAGGSGKTRLALRAAEARGQDYEGGPCFVGFADITDPDLIAPTICAALGVAERPGLTPVQRLERRVAGHRLLLVLDNLEQLAAGAALLGQLLAACAGLTLLVTSREPLHLSGERQYEVPALDLDDAVDLLTTRARAIKPDAELEAELAAAICERLDRLPLAIELAAARTKALSPTELLARLDRSLPLLGGGPRDAPQRQRTLRATIDWSYALLNDQQQRLFARMAVFAGGCTLAAAEAVCQADLDTLQTLVDRSLIRSDGKRFWMLQTLREYAFERLEQTGEEEALRRAHAEWLIELLEQDELAPPRWPTERSRHHVLPERDNFRAALEWASSTAMTEILARLAAPLVGVWITGGQLQEAERWTALMIERIDEYPVRLAAQVVSAARSYALHRGDHVEAVVLANRALTLWREVGDPDAIGREMASFAAHAGGDLAGGRRALEQAVEFAREHGLTAVLATALNNLADLAIQGQELDEARSLCEESLAVSAPGSVSAGSVLINLAHIASLDGQHAEAERLARGALEAALRRGDLLMAAWATLELAWSLAGKGELEQSGRLLGAGNGFLETAGAGRQWMDEACDTAVRTILHDQLEPETVAALLDEGRNLALEDAVHSGRPAAPAVTKAFMFTDIEKSTDLLSVIGDEAWVSLRAWHDRALRELFSAHGGEEISHTGDGFFVAFPSTTAAVECAVEIQRTLDRQRREHGFAPAVRIGLHAAPATRTPDGYVGRGVHEAARIAGLAHGAEILASADMIAQAAVNVPGSEPRPVKLKGLNKPVEIVTINWRT